MNAMHKIKEINPILYFFSYFVERLSHWFMYIGSYFPCKKNVLRYSLRVIFYEQACFKNLPVLPVAFWKNFNGVRTKIPCDFCKALWSLLRNCSHIYKKPHLFQYQNIYSVVDLTFSPNVYIWPYSVHVKIYKKTWKMFNFFKIFFKITVNMTKYNF